MVAEKGTRRGGFGPEDEVWLHRDRGEGLVFVGFEDIHLEFRIVAHILRDAGLDGGEGEFDGGGCLVEKVANAVGPGQSDESDRESEVVVRAAGSATEFEPEACERGGEHEVRHGDEEGNAAHAGDVCDLDEGDVGMLGNAEAVPSESGKDDAAKPFHAGPACGAEGANTEIVERVEPWRRLGGVRIFPNQKTREDGPAREVKGKIQNEQDVARPCEGGEPEGRYRKKDQPAERAESGESQPFAAGRRWRKPNGPSQRHKGDPYEIAEVGGRIAQAEEHSAEGGENPRQQYRHGAK